MRFNLPVIPPARRARLKQLFDLPATAPDEALVDVLARFVHDLGLPARLDQVADVTSLPDLDGIVADTLHMAMTPNNPRPATAADIETLLLAIQ